MKKRMITMLLAVTMCVNLLAGCGTAAVAGAGVVVNPSTQPTSSPSTEPTATKEELNRQRIEMIDKELAEIVKRLEEIEIRRSGLDDWREQLDAECMATSVWLSPKKRQLWDMMYEISVKLMEMEAEKNDLILKKLKLEAERSGLDGTRPKNGRRAEIEREMDKIIREIYVLESVRDYCYDLSDNYLNFLSEGVERIFFGSVFNTRQETDRRIKRLWDELITLQKECNKLLREEVAALSPTPSTIPTPAQTVAPPVAEPTATTPTKPGKPTTVKPADPTPVAPVVPTSEPTIEVTPTQPVAPTPVPTSVPTTVPTSVPSQAPTSGPTSAPSNSPTAQPSVSPA